MIPSTTQATIQLGVPNECPMEAGFTADIDLRFQFGEPGSVVEVTFERLALERFVHLALDLLTAPWPDDGPGQLFQPAVRSVA